MMGIAERTAIQRRLSDRSQELADRMIAAVVDEVPAYATLAEAQRQEVTAIARWTILRLGEMWVDDSRLDARDLARFRGIGAARAADGRPLMAVLRAYRVAAVVATDAVVSDGRGDLTVHDLAALMKTQITGLDDISEALFSGYDTTADQLTTDRRRLLEELVNDLLTGRQTSPAALADRAGQLGVRLPGTFTLLVTDAPAGGLGAAAVEELAAALGAVLLGVRRAGAAVVLTADRPGTEDVEAVVTAAGRRGCVIPSTTAAALPHDYKLAAAAMEHAPAEAFARRAVLDRGDALVVAVLRGDPVVDRNDLRAAVLGAALEDRRQHVLEGLTAYLRHGSAAEAAAALHLHPQTMRGRLRRLTQLTGRRLDDSWDRLVLEVTRGAYLTGG